MVQEKNHQQITEQLFKAGVSEAQIHLAAETSGTLLELLASYPLDPYFKKSVTDIFAEYAASQNNQDRKSVV